MEKLKEIEEMEKLVIDEEFGLKILESLDLHEPIRIKKNSISERAEYLRTCVVSSSYDKEKEKRSYNSEQDFSYNQEGKLRVPPGFEDLVLNNQIVGASLVGGPKQQFYSKILSKSDVKRKFIDDPDHVKRYSAGILPFYVKNRTIYFLLGRDTPRDLVSHWSDFGGRSELGDNGRWDYTAAREFYEETIGSVMDISTIMSKLTNKKNYTKIKGFTLNGSSYYMYLVKIPYKDYRQNFQSTLSFIKYIQGSSKTTKLEYKYFEKTDIQWISLDTIIDASNLTDNSELYPLRPVFKKTLFDNIDLIKEFCQSSNNTNIFVDN